MCRRAGFRDCNHVTTADGPGQRDRCRRTIVGSTNACKRGITQQAAAAKRRKGHHRHGVPLTPRQQIKFNVARADAVRDLIDCAAVAMLDAEEVFHVMDTEVGYPPGVNLSRRAETFKSGY